MKVTTANIGSLEFSASSSSSDSEFDSIVKSLEGEELELLGDYTEVGPPVQTMKETVCGKGKFFAQKTAEGMEKTENLDHHLYHYNIMAILGHSNLYNNYCVSGLPHVA